MLSRHFLAVLFWHRGALLYRHIVADLSWLAMTRDNWNFDALFVRLCVAFRMLHLHALLLWHGMALLNGKLAWSCVTVSLWHRHAELLGRGMAHGVGYGVALLPVLRMAILVIDGFTVFAGFSSGHIDAFFCVAHCCTIVEAQLGNCLVASIRISGYLRFQCTLVR